MSSEERGTNLTSDEAELAKMGYKQELKRDLSLMQVRIPTILMFVCLTNGLAHRTLASHAQSSVS